MTIKSIYQSIITAILALFMSSNGVNGQTSRGNVVKESLNKILSSKEFAVPPPYENPLDKAWSWIISKISGFFEWLGKLIHFRVAGGGLFGNMVYVVILLALILLIAFLIRYTIGRRRNIDIIASDIVIASMEEMVETISDPDQLAKLADELALLGDYRLAIRALFLSTLRRLDGSGVINFDLSSTNGEYVSMVSKRPELKPQFRSLVSKFDGIWYGSKLTDRVSYSQFKSDSNDFCVDLLSGSD